MLWCRYRPEAAISKSITSVSNARSGKIYLKEITMSNLNLTKLEWNTVPDSSIGGNGAPRRTNLRSAQAECGACGFSWRANATSRPTGASGEVFEYMGGMAVDCPSCKVQLKLDGTGYTQLYR